jgi:hypothetical protein
MLLSRHKGGESSSHYWWGSRAWPLAARAQQSMPMVGYVTSTTVKLCEGYLAGVSKGLAEQGYIEGKDFRFELREAIHIEKRKPSFERTTRTKRTLLGRLALFR